MKTRKALYLKLRNMNIPREQEPKQLSRKLVLITCYPPETLEGVLGVSIRRVFKVNIMIIMNIMNIVNIISIMNVSANVSSGSG